jgi:hypothetical protein
MWAWRSIQVARAAKTAHTAYKAGQVAKNTSVVVRGSSGATRAAVQASDDALTRLGAPATNATGGRAVAEGGKTVAKRSRGRGLVRDASLTAGTGGATHAASSNASKKAAQQAEKQAAKKAKKQRKRERNANVARNAGRFSNNSAGAQLPGSAPAVRSHTNPWARRL